VCVCVCVCVCACVFVCACVHGCVCYVLNIVSCSKHQSKGKNACETCLEVPLFSSPENSPAPEKESKGKSATIHTHTHKHTHTRTHTHTHTNGLGLPHPTWAASEMSSTTRSEEDTTSNTSPRVPSSALKPVASASFQLGDSFRRPMVTLMLSTPASARDSLMF